MAPPAGRPGGFMTASDATASDANDTARPDTARSTRDLGRLRADLQEWLAGQLPPGSSPEVSELREPASVGQSSETLLFEAAWQDSGGTRTRRLVARVAPQPADLPLFPSYDLAREYQTMRAVAQLSDAPVPEALWLEPDPAPLGSPFFVMSHVEGQVPSDIVYLFDSWLARASGAEQREVQDSTIDVLARLHAVPDPARHFAFLQLPDAGDTPLRRHVAHAWKWYEYAAARGGRFPLIERGFRWLHDNWPAREGEAVLLWGDARVGNVLYRDFRPAAILDWEMAVLGPRELDIAWLVSSHRVFADVLAGHGLSGMPHFLKLEDVAATYEAASGYAVADMDFYLMYASVQWAIVSVLANYRRVHFGQLPKPDDSQDLMFNRACLERLLDGGTW
jgi:aminoglycoside phosphotransferase (APT) family kinase protein